jgi:hypothetical protein
MVTQTCGCARAGAPDIRTAQQMAASRMKVWIVMLVENPAKGGPLAQSAAETRQAADVVKRR